MFQAVPLEEHLAGLDVYLLDDPFDDPTLLRATNRGEIKVVHPGIDRKERTASRGDEEFVEVPFITVTCTYSPCLLVGAIEDAVLGGTFASFDALPEGTSSPR